MGYPTFPFLYYHFWHNWLIESQHSVPWSFVFLRMPLPFFHIQSRCCFQKSVVSQGCQHPYLVRGIKLNLVLVWVSLNSHTSFIHCNSVFVEHVSSITSMEWQGKVDTHVKCTTSVQCTLYCPTGIHLHNTISKIKLLTILRQWQ